VCSTSAWWVFPRPMEFASEDLCKIECSIGGLWIFPQPMDFLARNLKITWTDKDLKGKENIKRRDRGKRLEERENYLSKGENVGKR